MYYLFCFASSLIFLYYFVGGAYLLFRYDLSAGGPLFLRSAFSLAVAVGCYVRARQDRDEARALVENLRNLTVEEAETFLSESATAVYQGYERQAPGERFYEYQTVRFGVAFGENGDVLVRLL
jgi:hypothetical protein